MTTSDSSSTGKPRFRRIAAAQAKPEHDTGSARPSASSRSDSPAPRREGGSQTGRSSGQNRNIPAPETSARWQRQPVSRQASMPASSAEAAGVRISKLMAERGICSRREADTYIEQGLVFVNGVKVTELGTRADPSADITLAREAKLRQARRVTILLNKPVGYVSGQAEDGYEPAVVLIRADNQYLGKGDGGAESGYGEALRFSSAHLRGLAPAGRLDIDSTGLLVLTQDGRVARRLIGDDSDVEKEYLVRVEGRLIENGLKLLNHGLSLDGRQLRPAKVSWSNEDQLRFVLREGRKRQIRRMCELVGLHVIGLKRVRIGRIPLSDLPLGQWRYLREDERF